MILNICLGLIVLLVVLCIGFLFYNYRLATVPKITRSSKEYFTAESILPDGAPKGVGSIPTNTQFNYRGFMLEDVDGKRNIASWNSVQNPYAVDYGVQGGRDESYVKNDKRLYKKEGFIGNEEEPSEEAIDKYITRDELLKTYNSSRDNLSADLRSAAQIETGMNTKDVIGSNRVFVFRDELECVRNSVKPRYRGRCRTASAFLNNIRVGLYAPRYNQYEMYKP